MTDVIAEIGINHNGSLKNAIDMIEAASRCGAHHVKFQKRDIDMCYTREELDMPCESPWGSTVMSKVCGRELAWEDFNSIAKKCDSLGVGWSASCFDLKSLHELETRFGDRVAFHKVPSAMAKHPKFLEQVASYGRLALVSVGLAGSMIEVRAVCHVFESASCPYILNVTTPVYPSPPERCNLYRVNAFRGAMDGYLEHCVGVGYSGHEVGLLPSIIAACHGVEYIERHFTLDRSWYGADQAASLEPEGLRRLCRDVSQVAAINGSCEISLVGDEKNPVQALKEWP